MVIGHWTAETMRSVLDEVENYDEDRRGICLANGDEILPVMRKLRYSSHDPVPAFPCECRDGRDPHYKGESQGNHWLFKKVYKLIGGYTLVKAG
jgi:hypothetical protein